MLKKFIALTAIIAGTTMSAPASAHFSQVFGPLSVQLASYSTHLAPMKMTCDGRSVAELALDWASLEK
jgi:hypothetical protein